MQWALPSAWIHPDPFPGGIHSAPTLAELDTGMSGVIADPVTPSPTWDARTPDKDTLAHEGGQGRLVCGRSRPGLQQCDATSLGPHTSLGHETLNETNSCHQRRFLFSCYNRSCFPAVLDPGDHARKDATNTPPAQGVQGWTRGLPRAPRAHGLFVCPSVQTQ